MPIISKETAGFLLLVGLLTILTLNFIFIQPILISLALVLGLILAIVFLYNPKWGLFLIIFIRPSIDKFSEEISIGLSENLRLNAAAAFGVLVISLLIVFLAKNWKTFYAIPLKKIWAAFILVATISIFFSIDISASFYEIVRIISIFLVFASFYVVSKKENNPKLILYAIGLAAVVPFLLATYQLVSGTGLGTTEGIDSRLFGTFSHPNPFASFIVITLAVLIFIIFRKQKMKGDWVLYAMILWGFVLLVETYSRGAWLAFLLFLLVLCLLKSPKTIILIAASLVVIFLSSESVQTRVQDVYNPPADSSVRWRFAQWGRMYAIFLKSPLTGQGIGTETIAFEQEYGFYAGNPYTHDDFLRIALETGVFGLAVYSLLILLALRIMIVNYRKEDDLYKKNYHLFVLALFLAMISFSLTNNTLRETVTQWTVWGLIGTSLGVSKKKE